MELSDGSDVEDEAQMLESLNEDELLGLSDDDIEEGYRNNKERNPKLQSVQQNHENPLGASMDNEDDFLDLALGEGDEIHAPDDNGQAGISPVKVKLRPNLTPVAALNIPIPIADGDSSGVADESATTEDEAHEHEHEGDSDDYAVVHSTSRDDSGEQDDDEDEGKSQRSRFHSERPPITTTTSKPSNYISNVQPIQTLGDHVRFGHQFHYGQRLRGNMLRPRMNQMRRGGFRGGLRAMQQLHSPNIQPPNIGNLPGIGPDLLANQCVGQLFTDFGGPPIQPRQPQINPIVPTSVKLQPQIANQPQHLTPNPQPSLPTVQNVAPTLPGSPPHQHHQPILQAPVVRQEIGIVRPQQQQIRPQSTMQQRLPNTNVRLPRLMDQSHRNAFSRGRNSIRRPTFPPRPEFLPQPQPMSVRPQMYVPQQPVFIPPQPQPSFHSQPITHPPMPTFQYQNAHMMIRPDFNRFPAPQNPPMWIDPIPPQPVPPPQQFGIVPPAPQFAGIGNGTPATYYTAAPVPQSMPLHFPDQQFYKHPESHLVAYMSQSQTQVYPVTLSHPEPPTEYVRPRQEPNDVKRDLENYYKRRSSYKRDYDSDHYRRSRSRSRSWSRSRSRSRSRTPPKRYRYSSRYDDGGRPFHTSSDYHHESESRSRRPKTPEDPKSRELAKLVVETKKEMGIDDEYMAKMEEQKRMREEILKRKGKKKSDDEIDTTFSETVSTSRKIAPASIYVNPAAFKGDLSLLSSRIKELKTVGSSTQGIRTSPKDVQTSSPKTTKPKTILRVTKNSKGEVVRMEKLLKVEKKMPATPTKI